MGKIKLTPVEKRDGMFFKRDDMFEVAGVRGGKARTCYHIATKKKAIGLVTAGSRHSPQVNIVAHVAKELGIPCVAHTPTGELSEELKEAEWLGAKIVQHRAGYNSVIIRRARDYARESGFTYIPFGMECEEAVEQTARQVENIPFGEINRIIVPVGSGMTLCGVVTGMLQMGNIADIIGVQVGANPSVRLDKYCPDWWKYVILRRSVFDYDEIPDVCELGGVMLDPVYEAKCRTYMEEGDLLWIVGKRNKEIYR